MSFELHPTLAADTHFVGDLALSRVLLMDDANYPWLILVPRRDGLCEVCELPQAEQHLLSDESALVARALMELYTPDKLNIAALGNQVPQLHVHHIARFTSDAAWPNPVWGRVPRQPYADGAVTTTVTKLRTALTL